MEKKYISKDSKELREKRDLLEKMKDILDPNVNHPTHYNKAGIEAIEGIKGSMDINEYRGFLKGNVLKYLWRYEYKLKPLEDLKKAKWYLDKLIESVEGENEK